MTGSSDDSRCWNEIFRKIGSGIHIFTKIIIILKITPTSSSIIILVMTVIATPTTTITTTTTTTIIIKVILIITATTTTIIIIIIIIIITTTTTTTTTTKSQIGKILLPFSFRPHLAPSIIFDFHIVNFRFSPKACADLSHKLSGLSLKPFDAKIQKNAEINDIILY